MQLHKHKEPTEWKFKCSQRTLKPANSRSIINSSEVLSPHVLTIDTQFPKCLQTHSRFQNKLAGTQDASV